MPTTSRFPNGRSFAVLVLTAASFTFTALGGQDDGYTGTNAVLTTGPDITVWRIESTVRYGPVNNVWGYSVGTDACNIGSVPVQWCDHSDRDDCNSVEGNAITDHPVISSNLYRLRNGRFQQLGKSLMKHGFASANDNKTPCRGNDGTGNPKGCVGAETIVGPTLNVGCTDFYGPTTNARQPMAPRSEIDSPALGLFDTDYTRPSSSLSVTSIDGVLQVHDADIDPTLNEGAEYWVEVQYLSPDDAAYGPNGLNNASFIGATFDSDRNLQLDPVAETVREAAAVWAWKRADPEVDILRVDLGTTPEQRFHVARRFSATARGTEPWHVEAVVHNLNVDRAARALELVFPVGTTFSGTGFHGVTHPDEEYDDAPWLVATDPDSGTIRWQLQDGHLAQPEIANALRWGSSFTFWFDVSAPPDSATWEIELFEPGTPTAVAVPFEVIFGDGFESGDAQRWQP